MDSIQAQPTATKHIRKARNFLIEPEFQLKWVARVALVVSLITLIMGSFLYITLSETIEVVTAQTLGVNSLTADAQQLIIDKGIHDKTVTIILLVTSLLLLVTLLSLLTIVVTHKVAGPVYKIKRLLGSIDDKHLQLFERLRKGDELHDIYEEFNKMLIRLRDARKIDIDTINQIMNQIKLADTPKETLDSLQEIIHRYEKSVNTD